MTPLRAFIRRVAVEVTNRTRSKRPSEIGHLKSIRASLPRLPLRWELLAPFAVFGAAPQKPVELRDGDRVVFIGDTLIAMLALSIEYSRLPRAVRV